jgi:undecaprenyl-diphosphatase
MEYVLAVVMGLVEGLTEYIPVSSTGHLILAGNLLGFAGHLGEGEVGEKIASTFEVFIQLGAIAAVVVAYPRKFVGLLNFSDNRGFSGLRGIGLLLLTTVPAGLFGLATHDFIKEHLFRPWTVALGLAVGGIWIILLERFPPRVRTDGVDAVSWKEALAVGLFQCLAMLPPGMSRSASTILGGMMVGLSRKTAAEYSFFAAVPILLAAGLYDLYKNLHILQPAHIPVFAIGFLVSFLSAWVTVKLLLRFLSSHTLVPFGWYRLALAVVVFWVLWRQ